MKQVLIGSSGVTVEEVPAPRVERGRVLVAVEHSCISVGTEMSGVRASNEPLWRRVMRRPEQLKRVAELVVKDGLRQTRNLVRNKLAALHALGYSAAGHVIEVGEGVDDIEVGDRVACAGAQAAHHAQVICVPRNLVVCVPDEVDTVAAATVTLGAIALQGVRRAQPTLGETFVVVGLGLIGQLTAQMLRANGVRTVGIDLDRDRIARALDLGMHQGLHPDDVDEVQQVMRLTDGIGADAVIVTAASSSSRIVARAFQMCRRKARVVLVGDVGLDIERADIYAKELDFLVSTSYGPGRYDRHYEEQGLDYPVAYVRWTENRNMQAYLQLLAGGQVRVDTLVEGRFPVTRAAQAYASLNDDEHRPLALVLDYEPVVEPPSRRVPNPLAKPAGDGPLRIALVGAGGFAKAVHLPNLQALSADYTLRAVVARQGHSATSTARQFGAGYAATDVEEVLADADVDALLIATRHDLHGPLVLRALECGKHVFVEKPLCLERGQLADIEAFYAAAGDSAPLLMTGFNRRFSRHATELQGRLAQRSNPFMANYRVNAGYLPPDTWVHGAEGGGRNLGEACHFYDLFVFLAGSRVRSVDAMSIRPQTGYYLPSDNFVATLGFDDGSVATLTYTALGSTEHPKELLDVYVDGSVIELLDYRETRSVGSGRALSVSAADKGHRAELAAFARAVRAGGEWPIRLWEQLEVTRVALDVQALIEPASQASGD